MPRLRTTDFSHTLKGLAPRQPAARSTSPTFMQSFQSLLGKRSSTEKVNEEELFAATLYDRIKDGYGDSLAADFKTAFRLNMADKPRRERISSPERAANETLTFFANSTKLSREQVEALRSECFRAAQIDDKTDKLWDSEGSAQDRSIAVVSFGRAARLVRQRFSTNVTQPTSRNVPLDNPVPVTKPAQAPHRDQLSSQLFSAPQKGIAPQETPSNPLSNFPRSTK